MTQSVVVTGASSGLGREISRAFARRGARVALLARASDRLERARHEVLALGAADVLAMPVDVADARAVEAAADAVAAFGLTGGGARALGRALAPRHVRASPSVSLSPEAEPEL